MQKLRNENERHEIGENGNPSRYCICPGDIFPNVYVFIWYWMQKGQNLDVSLCPIVAQQIHLDKVIDTIIIDFADS